MTVRLESWLSHCGRCGLWQSSLGSVDGTLLDSAVLDEELRQHGLGPVRALNIDLTLNRIAERRPLSGLRVLDVGCAYGWFLDEARKRGVVGVGIEPDPDIAQRARLKGLDVRTGYFPGVAADGPDSFDVVSFNDVLEHLPDLDRMLQHCRSLLAPAGLLVIAAPDSGGFLYLTAVALRRLGVKSPLARLWQEGFPSPHLSYFSARSLDSLARKHGFVLSGRHRLRTLSCRGLTERITYDSRHTLLPWLAAGLLGAASPAINHVLPADLALSIYARAD